MKNWWGRFLDKIMPRTGLKAMVGGKVIDGCYACTHNEISIESRFAPEIHRCSRRIGTDGKHAVIYDPLDIPEDCPCAIKPMSETLEVAQT